MPQSQQQEHAVYNRTIQDAYNRRQQARAAYNRTIQDAYNRLIAPLPARLPKYSYTLDTPEGKLVFVVYGAQFMPKGGLERLPEETITWAQLVTLQSKLIWADARRRWTYSKKFLQNRGVRGRQQIPSVHASSPSPLSLSPSPPLVSPVPSVVLPPATVFHPLS